MISGLKVSKLVSRWCALAERKKRLTFIQGKGFFLSNFYEQRAPCYKSREQMLTVSNRTLDKLCMCLTERVFAKNRTAEWSFDTKGFRCTLANFFCLVQRN